MHFRLIGKQAVCIECLNTEVNLLESKGVSNKSLMLLKA